MGDDEIRVRSYRGLADCSLVTIRRTGGEWNILVDFGVTKSPSGDQLLQDIAENIRKESNGHIDAVVLTRDTTTCVGGLFSQRRIFDTSTVEYVWMPSHAHPEYLRNVPAGELHARICNHARTYYRALKKRRARLAPSFESLLAGHQTAVDQLSYINTLARKDTLYLCRGDSVQGKPFPNGAVNVFVLAPEKDVSVYYGGHERMIALAETLESVVGYDELRALWDFPGISRVAKPPNLSKRDWEELRCAVPAGGADAVGRFAAARNNSSLVFLLDVGGKRLLFSGTAQRESWQEVAETAGHEMQSVAFLKKSGGSISEIPTDLLDSLLPSGRTEKATVALLSDDVVNGVRTGRFNAGMTTLKGRCHVIRTHNIAGDWLDTFV